MSDTVKLIIELPKETYKTITADKYAIYDKMYYSIKNGIPLDDVKAEIHKAYEDVTMYSFDEQVSFFASKVSKILNNIGKENEDE